MIKHRDSHVDHGLTVDQLQCVLDRFADRQSFFIETFTLPRELGTVPCGLYGPVMGDPPIGEAEIYRAARGTRAWPSRLIKLPSRDQHEVTAIAGPHEEPCWHCDGSGGIGEWKARIPCGTCDHGKVKHACILYTAFGGPATPREPGDIRREMEALEERRRELSYRGDEHDKIYAKLDGLREKRDESDAFWADHALAAPIEDEEAPRAR